MNRFKIQLSRFDIGMIIAFVVVGLLGGAAWWFLSGQLQSAQAQCTQVSGDYNSYATSKGIIVSPTNAKTLQANSVLLQTQLDPVMSTYLLAKGNDLSDVHAMDPVGWKKELDDDVKTLTSEAKGHSITVPDHFYYGFSRYLTESPGDAATSVLSKQRKAIKSITEILIGAQIKSLSKVRRSYEEDPHNGPGSMGAGDHMEGDQLSGYAVVVPETYTAYPFEFEFDASPEALRPILDGLLKSPYLLVLRSIEVHNEQLDSPKLDDLPKLAGGTGAPSLINTDPGVAAQSTPTVGPQKLFGYAQLHVKMRVDMIEWNPDLKSVADLATTPEEAMKKQVEPIILVVALLILAIGAAGLAYFYPTVKDITGIAPLSAQGKNVTALKADDITGSLVAWTAPVFWNDPASHSRLFSSDKYVFFPSAYNQNPNGNNYIVKIDKDSHTPDGVLISWYDEHGLDWTDVNVETEDPDGDGFSNITEYKNEPVGVRYDAKDVDPAKATNPNDSKSHPDYLNRLRLQKYESVPFHILFYGYNLINGKMLFQLHLDDVDPDKQPALKASGDPLGFGGFVIGPFHEAHQDVKDPGTGGMINVDISTLELDQPDTGLKVILPFRKKINSPEVTADFVMLMPTERDKVIRISAGKTFSVPYIKDTTFLVVSADANGAVIRSVPDGKTYTILSLLDKEWNEVPPSPAEKQP